MPKINRPLSKWDQRFIKLAKFVAGWSKDPKSKVGAVVVTNESGAIALGYNGFPSGIEDDTRLKKRNLKLDMIIHAEQNALIYAGSRAKGASLYVWGKPICARCAVVIIQMGIERIFSVTPEFENDPYWRDSGELAVRMFKETNKEINFYPMS